MTIDFLFGMFFLTIITSVCFLMLEGLTDVLNVTKSVLKIIKGMYLAVLIALFGYMFGTSYLYSIQHAGELSFVVETLGWLCIVVASIGIIAHSKRFRKEPEAK